MSSNRSPGRSPASAPRGTTLHLSARTTPVSEYLIGPPLEERGWARAEPEDARWADCLDRTEVDQDDAVEALVHDRAEDPQEPNSLRLGKITDEHRVLDSRSEAVRYPSRLAKTTLVSDVIGKKIPSPHAHYLVVNGLYVGISPRSQAPSSLAWTSKARR